MRLATQDKTDERAEMEALRARLYQHVQQGSMNIDVDAAYWTLDRALAGKAMASAAIRYARETLMSLGDITTPKVEIKTRALTKEEHDALLASDAPKSVSREDYERMMREAQE